MARPRRRHLHRRLALALALLLILFATQWSIEQLTLWLRADSRFPVQQLQLIRVDGAGRRLTSDGRLDPQRVKAELGPAVRGNMLLLDLKGLELAVAALPWVERVSVRRRWPHTLEVRLTERTAIARWGRESLLDRHGELFTPAQIADDLLTLPRLLGPVGREQRVWRQFLQWRQQLAAAELNLVGLTLDARGAFSLTLVEELSSERSDQATNHVEVILGRRSAEARIERLVRLAPTLLRRRPGEIARLDLRYDNGLAVRFREQEGNDEQAE